MRFSIDAHAIGKHLTGNEVYVRNLVAGLAALDRTSDFIAYLSPDAVRDPSAVPDRFMRREVSGNCFKRLGVDLSRRIRMDHPDLLHVQYTAPLACPVPVVVSVHDISFLEHPEYFPRARALQLRVTVKRTLRTAARVLTPSEFSKAAILSAYHLDPARVEAVPIAVSSMFRPVARDTASAYVRQHFGITTPFILTVGDLQPRKNQAGLIQAFETLIAAHPELPHELVIVGKDTWFSGRIHEAARTSRVAARIRFTGWVGDDDLVQFYSACDLLAFPSFYEGFGLPVLEAMACGCAVACSNSSAVKEVASSCALLFDPQSKQEMAFAMADLLRDPELRSRMQRLGLQRASLFTWERTAQRTLEVYYEVAGAGKPQPSTSRVPAATS